MKSLSLQEMEIILKKIDKYKDININEININDIDNLDDIEVNLEKDTEDRLIDFINATKNPYCFNINGCIVKFSYMDNDIDSSECVINAMKHIISK